jgi:DNA-binding IscR family transcriptional regulator
MQRDTRLARLLHVLIHMHLRGGATTSETIALMLHTNPVFVRRTMAALRESGYVKSTGGPGGGWALACDLNDLTVRDVYEAIGHTAPFVICVADDNHTSMRCWVQRKIRYFNCLVTSDSPRSRTT